MANIVRVGELGVPVIFDRLVEMAKIKRQLRNQEKLPEEITQDNLKVTWNSEEFRNDLVNIAFLSHLQYDVLIPYPGNAWLGSIFPDKVFTEIHSVNYYQKINGDCELTHALEDLYRILKPGGKAFISIPNFDLILDKILNAESDIHRLKWEHFLFSRNVDEKGLFYNQSICSYMRLYGRAWHAGFRSIEEDKCYGGENEKYLQMEPDSFDLPGVDNEARDGFRSMLVDPTVRRKKCIVPRCVSKAGQQEFKREQSVYCRRHYRKAKIRLQEMQEKALRIMVILKKE